jgi:hypothetical protein
VVLLRYYNFRTVHGSLRITLAMGTGLSDYIWSLEGNHRIGGIEGVLSVANLGEMTPMKILRLLALLIVITPLASLNSRIVHADSCGVVPVKPVPPVGCKDLKPECVCDSNGQNCHWEWVCVK